MHGVSFTSSDRAAEGFRPPGALQSLLVPLLVGCRPVRAQKRRCLRVEDHGQGNRIAPAAVAPPGAQGLGGQQHGVPRGVLLAESSSWTVNEAGGGGRHDLQGPPSPAAGS